MSDTPRPPVTPPLLVGTPEEITTRDDLVNRIDGQLDKSFARLERGYAALTDGQMESGRAIITLAAGALALSMTVVQLSAEDKVLDAKWLLYLSWIGFGVALLAAVVRFNWIGNIRASALRLEAKRGNILFRVREMPLGPTLLADLNRIADEELAEPISEIQRVVDRHDTLLGLMVLGFIAGLLALAVFTGINLP